MNLSKKKLLFIACFLVSLFAIFFVSNEVSKNKIKVEDVETTQLFDEIFLEFSDKIYDVDYIDINNYFKENKSNFIGSYHISANKPTIQIQSGGSILVLDLNTEDYVNFEFTPNGDFTYIEYKNSKNGYKGIIDKFISFSDTTYRIRPKDKLADDIKVINLDELTIQLFTSK